MTPSSKISPSFSPNHQTRIEKDYPKNKGDMEEEKEEISRTQEKLAGSEVRWAELTSSPVTVAGGSLLRLTKNELLVLVAHLWVCEAVECEGIYGRKGSERVAE